MIGLALLVISNISATYLGYFAPNSCAGLWRIDDYSTIVNNGLHSEMLLQGYISNKSIIQERNYNFSIILGPAERISSQLSNIDVSVCDGELSSWGGDYQSINLPCNITIPSIVNVSAGSYVSISFSLANLNASSTNFFIRINYDINRFVDTNGNYYIAWVDTSFPDVQFSRTLVLPSTNSVIESLKNFDIVSKVDGKWVLETHINGDAMVWFTDAKKEKDDKNEREWLIIVISLALSIIIQLYFSQKMTKRTINLWMFSEVFLVITGIMLFFELGKIYPYILILSFILFFVIAIFAWLSGIRDAGRSSWKRQLKDIWKFIVSLFPNRQ